MERQGADGQPARDDARGTVRQLAELLGHKLSELDIELAVDGSGFKSRGNRGRDGGLLSVRGELKDSSRIVVGCDLLQCHPGVRVPVGLLVGAVQHLGEKCRLGADASGAHSDESALSVQLEVAATPLSLARQEALASKIDALEELAQLLQKEVPQARDRRALEERYKRLSDHLQPVYPWDGGDSLDELTAWAEQTYHFLQGGACVAAAGQVPLARDLALGVLSGVMARHEETLGVTVESRMNVQKLIQLVEKAPGTVSVHGPSVTLGSNAYEVGNEVDNMLRILSSRGRPVLFTGAFSELQRLFSGGQGGSADPLRPVLRRVPQVPVEALAHYAVHRSAARQGGLGPGRELELAREVLGHLEGQSVEVQKRVLPMVAARRVRTWMQGRTEDPGAGEFVAAVAGASETLGGLTHRKRSSRTPAVQGHLVDQLTSPDLLSTLQERLLGQERALQELAYRLRMECLTRPSHQPLRYCAQGTPGTGKSESAVLLSRYLRVPYINIDAASMPDYYTASAQLLGSGRGIVGSYKAGRLEQAARHHAGAVVEISDLDHARPAVRSCLADLFLQILETGEGQTATGAMFSCANLILAFTINLPEGKDEQIHRRLGFGGAVSHGQASAQVNEEIKQMLSSAFLSRIGSAILFDPLGPDVLAGIVERTVLQAAERAVGMLGDRCPDVVLAPGLGRRVLAHTDADLVAFGARGVVERARSLTTDALLASWLDDAMQAPETLTFRAKPDGTLCAELTTEKGD